MQSVVETAALVVALRSSPALEEPLWGATLWEETFEEALLLTLSDAAAAMDTLCNGPCDAFGG